MTEPQKKALCALYLLTIRVEKATEFYTPEPERMFFSRWEIGSKSRGTSQGYPLKTMKALEVEGYVEWESEEAVRLYETGRCRCGCDRWAITPKGVLLCRDLNIVQLDRAD